MQKKDIKALFNKFAGREIPMSETTHTLPRSLLSPDQPERTSVEVKPANPQDPTLAAMHKTAADNGLDLNVYWKGGSGVRTHCWGPAPANYIVAYIDKESDGKWRVSKKLDFSSQLKA